jgi:hypothetical protein
MHKSLFISWLYFYFLSDRASCCVFFACLVVTSRTSPASINMLRVATTLLRSGANRGIMSAKRGNKHYFKGMFQFGRTVLDWVSWGLFFSSQHKQTARV